MFSRCLIDSQGCSRWYVLLNSAQLMYFLLIKLTMSRLATTITLTLVVTLTIVHHALSIKCKCGIEKEGVSVASRILGGNKVPAGKYPWLVYVQNRAKKAACTGSIINNRYVLIASHCVDDVTSPDQMMVYHDLEYTDVKSMLLMHKATPLKVIDFTKKTLVGSPPEKDDIALLKLETSLEFTETFSPICLTPEMEHNNYFAAGWGRQEVPSVVDGKLQYPVLSIEEEGRLALSETPIGRNPEIDKACGEILKKDTNFQMCVYGANGDPQNHDQVMSNVCAGDSGGPLMTRKDGRVFTVGVASTSDCNAQLKFATYEKTIAHKDWIKDNTKDAEWCEGSSEFLA